jgi:hypothetical protein
MTTATATATVSPVEVGAWTLEYLGPGFRVQVRVSSRGRYSHISGWMSPAVAARVFLLSMADRSEAAEAELSPSGRFEYDHLTRAGGYRLAFISETAEQPFMTPPFWV